MTVAASLVRPLVPGDAPALHAAVRASLGSLSQWFAWAHPGYSPADAESRIAHCVAARERGEEHAFGIFDEDGGLLGCVGLNRIDVQQRCANLGYWVGEAQRGKGLATRAAAHAAAFGFDELELARIEIVALPDNVASQRVAEKLGALREGVFRNRIVLAGGARDAVVFSLVPGATLPG